MTKSLAFLGLVFILFNSNAHSNSTFLQDVSVEPKRETVFINFVLKDILTLDYDFHKEKELYNQLITINRNTQTLSLEKLNLLLMSEFYKLTLSSDLIKQTQTQMSKATINSAREKLFNSKNNYSPLSKHIVEQIIADYETYLRTNSLRKYYSGDLKQIKEVTNLKKILRYTSAWINSVNTLTPGKFNKLITEHSIKYLNNLSVKSAIFKFHSSPEQKTYSALFKIKNLQQHQGYFAKQQIPDTKQNPLKQASQIIEKLKVSPEDSASKEIDNLLENIEEN